MRLRVYIIEYAVKSIIIHLRSAKTRTLLTLIAAWQFSFSLLKRNQFTDFLRNI